MAVPNLRQAHRLPSVPVATHPPPDQEMAETMTWRAIAKFVVMSITCVYVVALFAMGVNAGTITWKVIFMIGFLAGIGCFVAIVWYAIAEERRDRQRKREREYLRKDWP
jgi:hypothetical protein